MVYTIMTEWITITCSRNKQVLEEKLPQLYRSSFIIPKIRISAVILRSLRCYQPQLCFENRDEFVITLLLSRVGCQFLNVRVLSMIDFSQALRYNIY